MKNVRLVSMPPALRIPIPGVTPSGWSVQYVSGIENNPDIKPGYWLSQWSVSPDHMVTFNFEAELNMWWSDEKEAKQISDFLRQNAEIETKVVKVP